MKGLFIIAITFSLALVACKPKTSKEEKDTKETTVEVSTQIEEKLTDEIERIDSINKELEKSVEKLDELLNELK